MELLDGIILGIVQGITEFLPISSTGHLVLVREWLSTSEANGLAIDAVLHFATTAAVIVYFWKDLMTLVHAVFRKLGRLPVNQKDITLFYALVIGTIPAVIFGFFLQGVIAEYLRSATVVAVVLAIASVFFLFAEWKYFLRAGHDEITVKKGLWVGFYQALALIPGFSRSGATIAGGMLLGLTRYEASRFSFLLAIPITLAVGIKMSIDLIALDTAIDWTPIIVGATVSFFTALLVIHFFLAFIRKYTLWPFVWYGFILAGFVAYAANFT